MLRSHFWQRWRWRRGWDSFFRLVVEFGFRSRLEVVLDGKGEDKDDDSDDAEDEDIPPTNSTDNRIVPSVQTDSDLLFQ
jgi:hypothetical protein